MSETNTTCPKCTEVDLTFEVERHSAEDGRWYVAGFIPERQECDCEFSDMEVMTMEMNVANDYAESLYAYEP